MQHVGSVALVGAGPGDPDLLTLRAALCLAEAEVVVYDRLVSAEVLALIPPRAERVYVGKESGAHALDQAGISALLVERARTGQRVVRLKGGDPFVFGRGGEEAEALAAAGVPFEIVPGVTSAVAVPAYAGIPVTHRQVATSFAVTTGHEDPAKGLETVNWPELARGADTLVVLMGVGALDDVVARLLSAGRGAGTPTAVVRWGTTPEQQTVVAPLAEIAAAVRAAGLRPPALLVVGEVVALRERLRWFDRRPLFGRRVLVTRTREQASRLVRLLREQGARPIEVPSIAVVDPEDWSPADGALRRLGDFDWLVLTSANGVQWLFARLAHLDGDARWLAPVRVAAIGPATAAGLRAQGIVPDLVPAEFRGTAVAEALVAAGARGQQVLLCRAAEVPEELASLLRAAGAAVHEVALYRTIVPAESGPRVQEALRAGVDIVTFTSSSTVRNLLALAGAEAGRLEQAIIACIGPVTARTAREQGLRVDLVAREYTVEGLMAALVEYCAR
ncbi:MAG: uroporphyrinogen-III C-methyltransferase [Chloroflexi bacterium]|nr:uroporphyrinogen-III C-methyltransferase [Chloroflexota bacterium]